MSAGNNMLKKDLLDRIAYLEGRLVYAWITLDVRLDYIESLENQILVMGGMPLPPEGKGDK